MPTKKLSAQDEANRKVFGYARVSTDDQNLDAQMTALQNAGCDRIYSEKISGAGRRRPELDKLLKVLRDGDTLIVQRLDRLGRDVLELGKMVIDFETTGVEFKSLSESIDTSTAMGKAFFYITAAIAQLERNLISERTKAGMAARKAKGVKFGRPSVIVGEKRAAILKDVRDVSQRMVDVAKKHGVSGTTINFHFPGERTKARAKLGL